jgi:hypothetical protein
MQLMGRFRNHQVPQCATVDWTELVAAWPTRISAILERLYVFGKARQNEECFFFITIDLLNSVNAS